LERRRWCRRTLFTIYVQNALSGVLEEYYEIDLKDSLMPQQKKTYQLSVQDGKIVLWEIFLLPMSLKEI
jgi:hypothetical protein